jgi:hypothetical protein
MGLNSAFARSGDHIVWVAREDPPKDDEWAEYVKLIQETGARLRAAKIPVRVLVLTDGSSPTPAQRGKLVDAAEGLEVRSAVISKNLVVRGVVTVLSWFQVNNKFFAPAELSGALAFLDVPTDRAADLWSVAVDLQKQLGHPVAAIEATKAYVPGAVRARTG